jgi:prepilin signal peptidase PulO-like enzyme (type II secretory pathway)
VALGFISSDAGLLLLQASVVAAPRTPPSWRWTARLRGPAWALVPILSIVVVVFAIRFLSDTATGLTYLALVTVPPLAVVALAWAARPEGRATVLRVLSAVVLTAVLFAIATGSGHSLGPEASAAILSALGCVTLGVLLAAVAPPNWLKLGILGMAAADVWLVASDLLQSPNTLLVQAQPAPFLGAHLPRLQSEVFGSVNMGFGDLFIAAVLGAVLATSRRPQWPAALLTLVLAGLFDLLFLVVDELPATVPVALALLILEGWERWSEARAGPSADRRRWRREAGTPRPAR